MSTKNLARTIVEGGRARVQEEINHRKTRAERRHVRQALGQVREADDWEGAAKPLRPREPGFRDFADRLKVAERFLQVNAGWPWNKVYSELCSKVDRRTMKGWHLIDAHVVPQRGFGLVRFWHEKKSWRSVADCFRGPWVDRHGILRYTQRKRSR